MNVIIAKNKSNGVESKFTLDAWRVLPNKYKSIFEVVEIPKPKEVIELEAAQAAVKKQAVKDQAVKDQAVKEPIKIESKETAETPQKSTQVEKEVNTPVRKKRSVKTNKNNTGNKN